jgi:tRNA(Ile)-lysidine synthase
MQSKLVKNFKNFIFQEKLFSGGESLVVGISGGADSVCLVELLLAVQEKFDLEIKLVHINYHLRGEESDRDEKFVREFAEKRSLELEVVDYEELSASGKNNEELWRNFRYKVFEKIRKEQDAKWTVVGHHQDDQVETFLINLFRGAGVEGLKGMKVVSEKRKILRPLLSFSKVELKAFLESIDQEWREDKSNEDNIFLRNRIRNELIPEIEERYSSNFKKRVGGVTKQLQDNLKITEIVTGVAYENVVIKKDNSWIIDVENFLSLDEEIKPLVFREVVKEAKGDLKNISENNYREFEKIMKSKKGKRQEMKIQNLKFEKVGNNLKINIVGI